MTTPTSSNFTIFQQVGSALPASLGSLGPRIALSPDHNGHLMVVVQAARVDFSWTIWFQEQWPDGRRVTYVYEPETGSVQRKGPEQYALGSSGVIVAVAFVEELGDLSWDGTPNAANFEAALNAFPQVNTRGQEPHKLVRDALLHLHKEDVILLIGRTEDERRNNVENWLQDLNSVIQAAMDEEEDALQRPTIIFNKPLTIEQKRYVFMLVKVPKQEIC
ncbi:hypothetical protein AX16_003583 [Volvariella volvacea WC 439]|nr:hypothetical protein AX16_003583 [Volvariella volvacea WC 439]